MGPGGARLGVGVAAVLPLLGCGGSSGSSPTPVPSAPPATSCAAGTPVSGVPALSRARRSGLRDPLDL
jgi:hypothetical protein